METRNYKTGKWNQTGSGFDDKNEDLIKNVLTDAYQNKVNVIIAGGSDGCGVCSKAFVPLKDANSDINIFLSTQDCYLLTTHASKGNNSATYIKKLLNSLFKDKATLNITTVTGSTGIFQNHFMINMQTSGQVNAFEFHAKSQDGRYVVCYLTEDDVVKYLGDNPITKKYYVRFLNYDDTVLDTQEVREGDDAIPPQTPIRRGYTFTSWQPSYKNIYQDTDSKAQYTEDQPEPTPVGKDENHLDKQLKEIQLHDNVLSIGDYSFRNCINLERVTTGKYTSFIGTNAFTNCSSLTYFSRFSDTDSSHVFDIVGNNAFRNTRLSKLYLSLRSSSIYTFWGDYCFADNPVLQEVHFLSSAYMANNMFYNCPNLTGVYFDNNHTSYVYPYVFRNCTGLQNIELPSKLWYISEHMFDGCKNLKTITWSDYTKTNTNLIQNCAFNGCESILSIELPPSIDSLSCLQDGCFTNCPNLNIIRFDGIDSDGLMSDIPPSTSVSVQVGKMYIDNLTKTDTDVFDAIISASVKYGIPIVYYMGQQANGCPHCTKFKKNSQTETVVQKMGQYNVFFMYTDYDNYGKKLYGKRTGDIYKYWKDLGFDIKSNGFVYEAIYYYDKNTNRGKTINNTTFKYNDSVNFDWIETQLNSIGYDYTKKVEMKDTVIETTYKTILDTGCFRLNHNATLIGKDGKSVKFKYDKDKQIQQIDYNRYESQTAYIRKEYDFAISSDVISSNVVPGKPFYNASIMKEMSDLCAIPCLTIYSLLGCDPCQYYDANIYNNDYFQSWLSSQNFYFCGMNVQQQPYYDNDLKFAINEWAHNANNYQKIDEVKTETNAFGEKFSQYKTADGKINDNIYTPVLIFYYRYNDENGSKLSSYHLYSYHNIQQYISHWGVKGTIDVLKRLCLYHFDGNNVKNQRWCVGVDKALDESDMPTWQNEQQYNKYYNASTYTLTMTSIGTLDDLRVKMSEAFGQMDYIGGCEIDSCEWFSELGMDSSQSPDEWNIKLFGKTWIFTDGYYTLSINPNDTKDVKSACNEGGISTGYRAIWTRKEK